MPTRWLFAALLLATLVAYGPALGGALLWDDAGHVTRPELRTVAGLARIWFEPGATQQYYPLLHSAFWLEHQLWGDRTVGYHLANVAFHALAACQLAVVLRRLQIAGAVIAAFWFALHPVCVESVAWISEQKNTLSTALFLAALLAYLRFDDDRRPRSYALASLLFAAALLTKTVTATLPAALLVIAWWRRGSLGWRRDWQPLLPWLAAGLAAGLFTAWVERTQIGAQGAAFELSALERLLIASRALVFYAGKLIWPANLTFIYPRWNIDAPSAAFYLSPFVVLGVLFALWRRRWRGRGPLAAFLLFAGTLFPALGFVDVFPFVYSFVADHFQYLASLALFAAAGAALARLPRAAHVVAPAVAIALAALTWAQARQYRDVFALYTTTLARNPACWMAHNNLAIALADQGRLDEAIGHTQRALALRPNYAEAENNLGHQLTRAGRATEAIAHLERALALQPGYAEAHNNLGTALMALGRTSEGLARFREAIRVRPGFALAHYNLGLGLARGGDPSAALDPFRTALRLNPDYADAETGIGLALAAQNKFSEALGHLARATRLAPDSADIRASHASVLAAAGRREEAIAELQRALQLNPGSASFHLMLADHLRQTGRVDEATTHLRRARELGAGPR